MHDIKKSVDYKLTSPLRWKLMLDAEVNHLVDDIGGHRGHVSRYLATGAINTECVSGQVSDQFA